MWPGTLSITSKKLPAGGTAMFALLAMAGDLGGSIGPGTVGMISQKTGDNIQAGLFFGGIFPVILIIFLVIFNMMKEKNETDLTKLYQPSATSSIIIIEKPIINIIVPRFE